MSSTISVIKGGRNQGTYVREELVYAYAAWISADFYKIILDTFTAARKHVSIRLRTKDSQTMMTDSLKHFKESSNNPPKWYDYANEADLINRIVIGMSAKEFKDIHGLPSSASIRDHVTTDELTLIDELLLTDSRLLNCKLDRDQRKNLLQVQHDDLKANLLSKRLIS